MQSVFKKVVFRLSLIIFISCFFALEKPVIATMPDAVPTMNGTAGSGRGGTRAAQRRTDAAHQELADVQAGMPGSAGELPAAIAAVQRAAAGQADLDGAQNAENAKAEADGYKDALNQQSREASSLAEAERLRKEANEWKELRNKLREEEARRRKREQQSASAVGISGGSSTSVALTAGGVDCGDVIVMVMNGVASLNTTGINRATLANALGAATGDRFDPEILQMSFERNTRGAITSGSSALQESSAYNFLVRDGTNGNVVAIMNLGYTSSVEIDSSGNFVGDFTIPSTGATGSSSGFAGTPLILAVGGTLMPITTEADVAALTAEVARDINSVNSATSGALHNRTINVTTGGVSTGGPLLALETPLAVVVNIGETSTSGEVFTGNWVAKAMGVLRSDVGGIDPDTGMPIAANFAAGAGAATTTGTAAAVQYGPDGQLVTTSPGIQGGAATWTEAEIRAYMSQDASLTAASIAASLDGDGRLIFGTESGTSGGAGNAVDSAIDELTPMSSEAVIQMMTGIKVEATSKREPGDKMIHGIGEKSDKIFIVRKDGTVLEWKGGYDQGTVGTGTKGTFKFQTSSEGKLSGEKIKDMEVQSGLSGSSVEFQDVSIGESKFLKNSYGSGVLAGGKDGNRVTIAIAGSGDAKATALEPAAELTIDDMFAVEGSPIGAIDCAANITDPNCPGGGQGAIQ